MQAELTFPFKTEVTTVALLTAPHEAHNDCSKLSSKTEGRRRICSWALGLHSSGVASRLRSGLTGPQSSGTEAGIYLSRSLSLRPSKAMKASTMKALPASGSACQAKA